MSIIYDSSVTNVNTPAAITGIIADRPAANTIEDGTLFISTDTQEIYSAQAGSWILVTTGGGGGSQNLDQVLAVGDTATNKEINLNSVNDTTKLRPDRIAIKKISNLISFLVDTGSNAFFSLFYGVSNSNRATVEITADANKTNFILSKTLGIVTNVRRLFCLQDSLGNNTLALQESIGGQNAEVSINANIGNTSIQLNDQFWGHITTITTAGAQPFIRVQNNTTSQDVTILWTNANLPASPIFLEFPYWTGYLANVNEAIINTNVDLSSVSFQITTYGVYIVIVGSNSNDLIFDNFVANGQDGQFITLLVEDTPVSCVNTLGNIIGTANINSKGLYKLMKVGNNIYSSHI